MPNMIFVGVNFILLPEGVALGLQSLCGDGWVSSRPYNFLLNTLVCSSKFTSKEYENIAHLTKQQNISLQEKNYGT
jgi:hypothetical protein